jgi:Ran GTPase-activating protein (RanGAP) involved in mRNA processing and transport
LQHLTGLTHLDLADNIFSGNAGALLATALQNQPNLRSLHLRDAGLGPKNFVKVVKAITEAGANLVDLDLSGNEIGADECEALVDYLGDDVAKSLVNLALDENEIGTEGLFVIADAISAAAQNVASLKTMSACHCEVTAAGAVRLSKVLTRLPGFRHLKIDGNQICGAAVEVIQGMFVRAKKILEGTFTNRPVTLCHLWVYSQKWKTTTRTATMIMKTRWTVWTATAVQRTKIPMS